LRAPSRAPKRARLDLLVDTYIETYVQWREECVDVGRAYGRWVGSAWPDRDLAFRAYRAALDREEKAATVHQLVSQRLGLQTGR
jgi:hypothetical protein